MLRGVFSLRGFLNLSYIGTAWRLLRDTGGWVPLWELSVRVSGLECEGPVSLSKLSVSGSVRQLLVQGNPLSWPPGR